MIGQPCGTSQHTACCLERRTPGKTPQTSTLGILRRHEPERFAREPYPRRVCVDVRKDTQNTAAMSWPAWERIYMQQVIALVQRQVATLLLLWPKAGVVQLPLSGVRHQEFA